jgi:hypothetical protein
MQTNEIMKNRKRYQEFKRLPQIKSMSPIQIVGYVLFILVLFLCGTTFTSCTHAKVATTKVERFDVDSSGVVFNLNRLRK